MTMIRSILSAEISQLGDDEVEIRMSTGAIARDGHILVPEGCVLDNYRKNPIQLWQHDPECPVGANEDVRVEGNSIIARCRFAPLGISAKADEVRGLVKSGIVRAVSVGFDPIDGEPLDPKRPRGGMRFSKWELLECSFVSVPADTGAVVTARELNRGDDMADWKVGAARDLPIEDSDSWDGPAAEASIFEYAGGDDFDPAKARRGFLVYDADKPKERGSYKLPIAHVIDGELKVPKGAIRAAASRLPQADIGDAKDDAEAVLKTYEKKAGIGDDDGERGRQPKRRGARRSNTRQHRQVPELKLRGLYEVGELAYLLNCLGWVKDCAEWEAAFEGDNSKVPAMLAGVLQDLGAALIAMTIEEVGELLGGDADDDDGAGLADDDVTVILASSTPELKRFRMGYARAKSLMTREGRKLSAETLRCMRDALDQHEEAMDHHRSAIAAHKRCAGMIRDLVDGADEDGAAGEGASQEIQTSDGTGTSEGSENDRAARRAEVEKLKRQGEVAALYRDAA